LKDNPLFPYQERFGDIKFPLAKETAALQAADLLVYTLYVDMQNRVQTGSLHPAAPSELIRILITNVLHKKDLVYQDEFLIRESVKQLPIEQRGDLFNDLAS